MARPTRTLSPTSTKRERIQRSRSLASFLAGATGALCVGCGGIVADEGTSNDFDDEPLPGFPAEEEQPPERTDPGQLEELSFDCRGEFSEPEVLFEDVGWTPQALSPSRDGREIFYLRLAESVRTDPGLRRRVAYRVRDSEDAEFGEPVALPEIGDVCAAWGASFEPAALDLSHDALRLYIGCNTMNPSNFELGPLFVASRSDRRSEFELNPEPIGQVGISMGLTRDELTAFTTALEVTPSQLFVSRRASKDEPFEWEGTIPLGVRNPEPSPTAVQMLGASAGDASGQARIVLSERQGDGSYSAPTLVGLPPSEGAVGDYSPAVGPDCRSIYFSRINLPPQVGTRVMVSRRL